MFNFTTQTIYNSINKFELTAEDRHVPKTANLILGAEEDTPFLRVGNTRFDVSDILDVQIKAPTVEQLAHVTFDMAKIVEKLNGDDAPNELTGRIVLYLGLSMNSQDSFYANNLVYKGKPIYIEFPAKKDETAATIAARVKAVANKYMLVTAEETFLDISVVDEGKVCIEAINGYQLIKDARLQIFDPNAKPVDCCSNQGEFIDIVVGVPVVYETKIFDGTVTVPAKDDDAKVFDPTAENNQRKLADNEVPVYPGLEAFCDYNWIIHNLRLPTAANTGFWSPTRLEMPAAGQVYTQFIIRLCKERDGIVGEIVGARAKSVTTHVLYVAGNYTEEGTAAAEVWAAIQQLAEKVEEGETAPKFIIRADTKFEKPFEKAELEPEAGGGGNSSNTGDGGDSGDNGNTNP